MYRYTDSGTEKRRWISLGEFTEINDRSVAKAKVSEYDKNIEKIGDPLTVTEGDQTFEELFGFFNIIQPSLTYVFVEPDLTAIQ